MTDSRVIALGFFDGVHIGHGALLRRAQEQAKALGCRSSALSYDTHPLQIITGTDVSLISTMSEREWLIKTLYGVDEVIFSPFDRNVMQTPWEVFLDEYLIGTLHASHLICGADFRFGYHGEGTAELLADACRARGIGCDVIEKVELDGEAVSSTRIRTLLQDGQMEQASRLLGHHHMMSGVVTVGQRLGRKLGFATANLPLSKSVAKPPRGVYCAEVLTPDGVMHRAVCNLGVHPTAGSLPAPVLEAHLLDFEADLYGQYLRVYLHKMLRPEQRFSSLEALCRQIAHDRETVRAYFA